jgi:hypothetical protein
MKCRAPHEWIPLRIDMGPRVEGEFVCRVCGTECSKDEAQRMEARIQEAIATCA